MFSRLVSQAFKTKKLSVVLLTITSWFTRSSQIDLSDEQAEAISVHTYMMN